ncbi:hypothetical protein B005_1199 [Nocardiopsis alba ATCC BAA-2165]|uniref:Uncharacterized protein n=1 Tax=Nocardiopsis alba (strain ATCC BAA-2165 / BE74) TaxID=1205910 RepID=J7LH78_NOCAA|nr:hypothetical protein B005_1199 [Nocardiopsis alba ATCC BAA-2165]
MIGLFHRGAPYGSGAPVRTRIHRTVERYRGDGFSMVPGRAWSRAGRVSP